MIFGIPHELKDHETRVGCGLVPRNVATLVSQGHTVYFQKGVMEPAGVPAADNGRHPPASMAFVPPAAGFLMASHAVRDLLGLLPPAGR